MRATGALHRRDARRLRRIYIFIASLPAFRRKVKRGRESLLIPESPNTGLQRK
jgi:hypothetical protein